MTKAKNIEKLGFWERNKRSGGYLLRKKIIEIAVSICRFILLFGMCFLILQPILNKISVSFMTEQDLYNPIVTNIPEHFTTANYKMASDVMSYPKALVNSIVISFTIALLQIAVCTLVGYGFARFKFPLKNMWFACVILVILIPPQTIVSSLYLHFRFFDIFGIIKLITGEAINLRGSKLPYYLMSATAMGLKNGLYIYMIRQFFRNIPGDMEEAAYVDGCGMLRTFARIMLPQSKPILSSCFLFAFVWQWTDGFYSKMFLGTTPLVSTSLARIVDSLGAYIQRISGIKTTISVAYSNCILSTGTLMIILPLIVIYLFAQRAFVESISATGIKM
ncbi:carbohydrate ABC transporter permease [Butyrivibrio fibrisolvens]|jgi:multiple sugar transport system permease protein|uniref:Multiple sugar transport system permease protein n=1 Tax=Butyrivibrio fibrisolvens TaxID=831 RepID=A0A1H9N887_BUTFI|nr:MULTISPECIES: carbohydrate ABC transporter permease [Butyrivibrio]MBQ1458855.1 carbohydrate ABC transporter permease [Butyrivibrio sp.]MCR4636507.1 carbohydrate ABC transporter permease [Butyrivibrio sp.]SER32196.1 multiple sugar transport system permease protein [Butyrivibrio fibrisolvens]